MSLKSLLTQRMDILDASCRRTDAGATDRRWPVVGAAVACSVQPLRADRKFELQRLNLRATHQVYFESNIVLDASHRVRIAGADYDVLAVEISQLAGWPSSAIVRAAT